MDFLQSLDIWQRCSDRRRRAAHDAACGRYRRLIRSPEVKFSSDEIGMEAFGYNIENRLLMVAMEARARRIAEPRAHR